MNPLQYIDKFYGFGQNHVTKTKIYSVKPEFMAVLDDFRRTYYFDVLQQTLVRDQISHSVLNGQKSSLISDIYLQASLNLDLLDDQDPLISIIVNVDIDQMLRVYSIKNDESQLMFHVNMNKIVDKELEISSFEFYM